MESFVPNSQYPQLCCLVDVGRDSDRGRYVKAIEDIPPGTVVCIEKGTVVSIDSEKCAYCLADVGNKHHCDACAPSVHRALSPFEGPFADELDQLGLAKLTLRILLSYPAQEVVDCIKDPSCCSPEGGLCSTDFRSVMALQKAEISLDLSLLNDFLKKFAPVLKNHPGWASVPFSVFRTAFRQVCLRLTINAHTIFSTEKLLKKLTDLPCGSGLFPIACLMNHSCTANVFSFFDKDRFIFVSKGIRKGEELVDNYGTQFHSRSSQQRKEFLEGRGFECMCRVCSTHDCANDSLLEVPFGYEDPSDFSIEKYRAMKSSFILPEGHIQYELLLSELMASTSMSVDDRIYCLNEILDCQRKRGMFLEAEQLPIFLQIVTCIDYDKPNLKQVRGSAWAAMLRMIMFYCKLHPAFEVTSKIMAILKKCTDDTISADSRKQLEQLVPKLQNILVDEV